MIDPLLEYRDRFPILSHTNYLISNSLGAAPRAADDALHAYFDTWSTRGVRAWEEGWWTLASDLGDLVAPLLGAGPGQIVFQPCVTIAHAVVLSALRPRAGKRKIVIDEGHFPSVLYSVGGLREQGLDVEVVPETDAGFFDTPRFLDAIDAQTSAVLACHVQFRTAEIIDVASIAKRAREFDALTIIDGYQAVGTIPIDVESLHVDAYIGGCLKWLCGGPGTAFLWLASARIRELNPTLSGWMAHRRPFAFEPKLDRRDDMWRFLHGTPNVPALFAARPGLELIGAVGLESIRAKSLRQTDCLMALADARGWQTPTPRDHARRGGTVALDVPNGLAVSRALKAREILCDYRTGVGIRLSPHFYTRNDELDDAMCAVADTLKTRDWERFIESRSAVT